MSLPIYILLLVIGLVLSESNVFGFVIPIKITSSLLKLQQDSSSSNDSLRDEIAAMKRQALDRLDILDAKLSETTVVIRTDSSKVEVSQMEGTTTTSNSNTSYESTTQVYNPTEDKSEREYTDKRIAVSNDPTYYNSRTERGFIGGHIMETFSRYRP
jgi:glucan-binding YG repeat protein